MSKMLAEIRRIVNEDISNRVTQYDVLFEAITNAIHANAQNIICALNSYDNLFQSDTVICKKVDTITITDDGDGFNQENYSSFCKYRTEFKKELGGKGVGRFVFLKVYEYAIYKSQLKEGQEEVSFKFDLDFDTEDTKRASSNIDTNSTVVMLTHLTSQYKNQSKNLDRRIELNLDTIRERVLLNLIPTLFFYKKKKLRINIQIVDDTTSKSVSITDADIPNFREQKFQVKNREGQLYDFLLNYIIFNANGNLHSFYCANNRTVCEFTEKDLNITLPWGYSGFFLLESDYLNTHVNNERNDFDIWPVRTDLFSSISWDMVNTALKGRIAEIIKKDIPSAQQINKEKLHDIQNERPYLMNYIEDDDINMAGFLDKKHIVEKAKKRFDTAKEKVLSNGGKSEYTNQELQEAIQLAQNELVSYINDRVLVLQRLKTLVDKKEKVEAIIHNLFMEKQTDDNYYSIGKNNLWLLDDRFTTYSYAASDKKITEVLNSLGEDDIENIDNPNDRPDLSLFFSQDPNKSANLKSVLVELKPFDFSSKSDRKKFQGVQQLIDYVKAFKTREKIEEIYGFLITDIDSKLAERLIGDGYTPLYSQESPIYHRFYDKIGISIYVVSAKTLIIDAEARNKVFLDIIRKQSKLSNFLKEEAQTKQI
ncbi:ATP-binding protein [Pararcticibacter amylolyticus]|uniref:ATP-binding protein n=1 Tax=Pararcticibacter amylolyticus TaxID=2173175 RepID=A0A2U2PIF5_9SPHI|nr:ATP-binding protein [Pararcticibacter amylolyticus]PWG81186.1 hypothetical protein DDR33_07300 [Pararcticibacter amylolyticus]